MNHSVDHFWLLNVFNFIHFILFHYLHYHHRKFLIFIKTYFHFSWLATYLTSGYICTSVNVNLLHNFLLHLLLVLLSLQMTNNIYFFLKCFKLNIIFLDVNIAVPQEPTNFSYVLRFDFVITMSPCKRFGESYHWL